MRALAACLCLAGAQQLSAQDRGGATANDSMARASALCWRGRLLPRCRTFILTELGFYRVAAGSKYEFVTRYPGVNGDTVTQRYGEDDTSPQLTAEAGVMQNVGPRTALGGTLLLGVGTGGADVGIKGRYRRWLGPNEMALDVGAGVISGTTRTQLGGEARGGGFTADVALNAADYGALVLRTDVLHAGGHTAKAIYGGVRLGSKPAVAGTAILAAGFLALLAIYSSSVDY